MGKKELTGEVTSIDVNDDKDQINHNKKDSSDNWSYFFLVYSPLAIISVFVDMFSENSKMIVSEIVIIISSSIVFFTLSLNSLGFLDKPQIKPYKEKSLEFAEKFFYFLLKNVWRLIKLTVILAVIYLIYLFFSSMPLHTLAVIIILLLIFK